MTPPQENVETLERLFSGVWNGEDPAVADDLVDPDYVIHDRDLTEDLRGPTLYRGLAEETRAIFPDARFTIEDVLAEGDQVAVRWRMIGTHDGTAYGVEPTGRRVELPAIEIDRFADGRLVETWAQSDELGLLQQIGAAPGGDSADGG